MMIYHFWLITKIESLVRTLKLCNIKLEFKLIQRSRNREIVRFPFIRGSRQK